MSINQKCREAGIKIPQNINKYCKKMFPGKTPSTLTETELKELLSFSKWVQDNYPSRSYDGTLTVTEKLKRYRHWQEMKKVTLGESVTEKAVEQKFVCPYLQKQSIENSEEIKRLRVRVEQLSQENSALLSEIRKALELQEVLKKFMGGGKA